MLQQLQTQLQQLRDIKQRQDQRQPQHQRLQQNAQPQRLKDQQDTLNFQEFTATQSGTIRQSTADKVKKVFKFGEKTIDSINAVASAISHSVKKSTEIGVGAMSTIAVTSAASVLSNLYKVYKVSNTCNKRAACNKNAAFDTTISLLDTGNSLLTCVSSAMGANESRKPKKENGEKDSVAPGNLGAIAGGLGVAARSGSAIRHFKKGEKWDGTISTLRAITQGLHIVGAKVSPVASTVAFGIDGTLSIIDGVKKLNDNGILDGVKKLYSNGILHALPISYNH